jgi:Uma2 family endonuclease
VEVTGDVEATMATTRTGPADAEAELADLERLWQTLDLPGHRIELIDGQIVVSPTASRGHSNIVTELIDQLAAVSQRRWERHTNLTVHIAPTRERLVPDLAIVPADVPGFDENELLASGVLLVAEVVSPHGRREDRDVKPRAYAEGGVPLYLLIDRFATPPTLTLLSKPGQDGYGHLLSATGGQPLRLPEPFGIALDTARLLG